ncbi:MAG: flp pilus-assembly TadE/G-like family protein [Nocardioidaceae bacterium]|nr:flp pilus-assembly TadE/G-like family protein [Nocardioidaceae bacterium]
MPPPSADRTDPARPDSAAARQVRAEAGVATVWGVAWIFVCLSIGWLGLVAAMVVAGQHHVDAAAELASLSGAARLQRGGDACELAGVVAADNDVEVTSCAVEGSDVVVAVATSVALPFGLDGRLVAVSRAGPD